MKKAIKKSQTSLSVIDFIIGFAKNFSFDVQYSITRKRGGKIANMKMYYTILMKQTRQVLRLEKLEY